MIGFRVSGLGCSKRTFARVFNGGIQNGYVPGGVNEGSQGVHGLRLEL